MEIINTIKFPKLYPWQHEAVFAPQRHVFIIAGRRSGKTKAAQVRALRTAIQGKNVIWVAPTHRQLVDNYREVADTAHPITISTLTNDEIIVYGQNKPGMIRFRSSAEPDNLRGGANRVDLVIFDEINFCKSDLHLRRSLKVLRPMLTETKGRCFYISSPNGHNLGYELFQRYSDPKNARNWHTGKYTWESSPHISPEEVESAKNDLLPSEFRQEYLASFESPTGALFESEWLDETKVFTKSLPPLNTFFRLTVAVDASEGRLHSDWQAVVFVGYAKDPEDGKDKIWVDAWGGRVALPGLCQQVKTMYDRYSPEAIAWEINGFGTYAAAEFRNLFGHQCRIWDVNNQIEKKIRIGRLATYLSRGQIKILDNHGGRVLHGQLCDFPVAKGSSYDLADALENGIRALTETVRR